MAIQYKMMTDENDLIYFVNRLTDEEYHIGDTIIKKEQHLDDEMIVFIPEKDTVKGFKMGGSHLSKTNSFENIFAVTDTRNVHLNDVIIV